MVGPRDRRDRLGRVGLSQRAQWQTAPPDRARIGSVMLHVPRICPRRPVRILMWQADGPRLRVSFRCYQGSSISLSYNSAQTVGLVGSWRLPSSPSSGLSRLRVTPVPRKRFVRGDCEPHIRMLQENSAGPPAGRDFPSRGTRGASDLIADGGPRRPSRAAPGRCRRERYDLVSATTTDPAAVGAVSPNYTTKPAIPRPSTRWR